MLSISMHAVATFSDLFDRLHPDPRVRGKQFEHVCKWFLTNDPTYKNTLRRVWLWSEWTGRWGGDSGIDLVAEDHDGRLWAIQAKAYAPENTITKTDVDKFLAESSRAMFSYRLLIATTDKRHHIARRTMDDQEKEVGFVGLSPSRYWSKSGDLVVVDRLPAYAIFRGECRNRFAASQAFA